MIFPWFMASLLDFAGFSHGFFLPKKRRRVLPRRWAPRRCTEERTDVFSEFLRNVEPERVARLGALNVARRMVSYWSHGHRNSGFTHEKWWFSIVTLVYQRVWLGVMIESSIVLRKRMVSNDDDIDYCSWICCWRIHWEVNDGTLCRAKFSDQFCVLEIASFPWVKLFKVGESNAIFTAMIQLSTKHYLTIQQSTYKTYYAPNPAKNPEDNCQIASHWPLANHFSNHSPVKTTLRTNGKIVMFSYLIIILRPLANMKYDL